MSRPRRFEKSVAAEMLATHYGKNINSHKQFQTLHIAKDTSYQKHLNKYNVIFLNVQQFLSRTHDIFEMIAVISKYLLRELFRTYPNIDFFDKEDLTECFLDIYSSTDIPFVFIIDEWDCIFREHKTCLINFP